MTLIVKPGFNGMTDADAIAYVNAVEAADGQLLEFAVGKAINDFVLGCKADGIWSAIKASCILAGARTLGGALVPLAGVAPTNVGGLFVSGDYNRKTGLVGNGSTKYLDSNRANNADPQNSKHAAAFVSAAASNVSYFFGDSEASGCTLAARTSVSQLIFRVNTATNGNINPGGEATGLLGVSRNESSSFIARANGTNSNLLINSTAPTSTTIQIFRSGNLPTNARIAFYSIGEFLALAQLDTRVTALITAIGAAIP
jgi:hypothetical protein